MEGPTTTASGILTAGGHRSEGAVQREFSFPPPFLPAPPHAGRQTMDLARNLKVESVSRLQPSPALHMRPHQTVADAIVLMRQHKVGCILVCEERKLVGIFTERDLMLRVL